MSCSLIGQKADVPVRLTHLGNNVYKAVYTPLISGTYELQVFYQGFVDIEYLVLIDIITVISKEFNY